MDAYIAEAFLDKTVGKGLYAKDLKDTYTSLIVETINTWENDVYGSQIVKNVNFPEDTIVCIVTALTDTFLKG